MCRRYMATCYPKLLRGEDTAQRVYVVGGNIDADVSGYVDANVSGSVNIDNTVSVEVENTVRTWNW